MKKEDKDIESSPEKKTALMGIRTIVVLIAKQPVSVQASNQGRRSILNDIKNNHYIYVPTIGKIGRTTERLYAVFNMSVGTAKKICGLYQQTSFVFTQLFNDSDTHSEYWEIENDSLPYHKTNNKYVKKGECDKKINVNVCDYSIVGNKYNYRIPSKILESVNKIISINIQRILDEEKKRGTGTNNALGLLDFTIYRVGLSPYLWRRAITRGFYNNCK